ncbi:MAG: transglutaminase-like domain-containing protein [Gemmatimonadota bacterium]
MTPPPATPQVEFRRELNRPDGQVNLARAALLIASEAYPQLHVNSYLTRLDQLAEEVRDRLADESAPLVLLEEMGRTLYERHGFRGNRDEYYDPRNSFLSDVLDRRTGIPLTLGIVYLEVGWRLGLPLEGVNFPGHFLVRFAGEEVRLLVDPFDEGRVRFEDEAQALLDRGYGGLIRVRPEFLKAAGRRAMLVRLLTNLRGVYLGQEDYPRALAVVDHILAIHPMAPGELRTRGTLLARMGRADEALQELERYLDSTPGGPDVARIRALVEELRGAGREKEER